MKEKFLALSIKNKIICITSILVIIIAILVGMLVLGNSDEKLVTEDVKVQKVEMQQTITAAGEVVTAEEEEIAFSSSKAFSALCVEENEEVSMGQHLILYSDGTYENAPDDGIITSINAPTSGYVGGSSYYLTFAYADKLALDITVPEGEINNVGIGDKAEILVNSDTSRTYTGKITAKKAISTTQLSSSTDSEMDGEMGGGMQEMGDDPFGSDSSTAYYTVSLEFTNDGSIKAGTSAICTITVSNRDDVMAVPVEAVCFDEDNNAYVNVVNGAKTVEKKVKTGESDATYVEIKSGLDGNETVRIERKAKS